MASVSFPDALTKSLELLREQVLGLTQHQLAESAHVAQGTYSNLMLGKDVRVKSARAIVVAIQQATESYIRRTNCTPQQAAEILRDVARAAAIIERGLDAEESVDSSENGAHFDLKVLDRLAKSSTSELVKIHQPGGPVPADAIPYVSREHDTLILETLQLRSFAMLVRGPSQCGKSTVLSLLERKAHEKGIETAWFDPQPPSSDTLPNLKYDANADADAALAICELLQAEWGLQRPKRGMINTIPKLNNWLLEELAPTAAKPRLLILDDLVTLGGPAAERWLSLFVRAMVNRGSNRGVNISLAVGLTEHFGAYFARKLLLISSVVHWKPMLTLNWLDQQQVVQLWLDLNTKQATDVPDESALSEIFEMFKGQPYLTHAALIDKTFRDLVRDWLTTRLPSAAKAIRQVPWYRRHLSAIRLALCGPTYEPDAEARRLIKSFGEACKPVQETPPLIDIDHGLFFRAAQLLDPLDNPALEIYRLIAEDLQGVRA